MHITWAKSHVITFLQFTRDHLCFAHVPHGTTSKAHVKHVIFHMKTKFEKIYETHVIT